MVNKTVTYEYDYVGNITAVKTYTYTTGTLGVPLTTQNYTYNSQNQRTDLSYDTNGNLTALNGYTFGWTNRRLTSATSTDNSISYTYNHDGIRTSKTVNGVTTTYTVDENNNIVEQTDGTNTINFVYDSDNLPIYMVFNGVTYYYEKNLQGDIVAILDANGNTVVQYSYDIWGKLLNVTGQLANTLGIANPLRYRGYYYDTETGLYYLQSRYYSPDLMRFISQDDVKLSNDQGEPLGSNLYAYCLNNPVMYVDPTGNAFLTCLIIGIVAGAIVGGAASYIKYKRIKITWVAGGAVIGGLVAAGGYWVYTTVKGAAATWSAYKATQIGAGASTSSVSIGRMFEKFYYSFNNIATKLQQVVWKNFRFDAIFKNRIIELKNYNWSKYSSSQIRSIARQFATQGQKYMQAIGQNIGGQKIKGITFYFSSQPPRAIIDALKALGIAVDWVK